MQIDSKWLSNYTYAIPVYIYCGRVGGSLRQHHGGGTVVLPRCCRHYRHASVNARSVTAGVRVDTVFHPPPSRASAAHNHWSAGCTALTTQYSVVSPPEAPCSCRVQCKFRGILRYQHGVTSCWHRRGPCCHRILWDRGISAGWLSVRLSVSLGLRLAIGLGIGR